MNRGTPYRMYATLGAAAGIIVATVYWSAMGAVWWWGLMCELLGAGLGAALGAVTGDGSVKSVWAGPVGAFVIPLVGIALVAFMLAAITAAQS